jgi:hypothetical protein
MDLGSSPRVCQANLLTPWKARGSVNCPWKACVEICRLHIRKEGDMGYIYEYAIEEIGDKDQGLRQSLSGFRNLRRKKIKLERSHHPLPKVHRASHLGHLSAAVSKKIHVCMM